MNPGGRDFAALPLSPAVLTNLERLGYVTMTSIQAASLPLALAGKDLIAQAKTGSGKTAAFALPLLARLEAARFAVQALVLCPTRELADQVTTEVRRLARAEDNVKVVTLAGGVPLRGQLASLEKGAHVVVGTPGRVLDLVGRGALRLDALTTLVLDEADRMLDMGFFDDIAAVARACPAARQTLLFSATYPEGIARLAAQFMRAPVTVKVEAQHAAAVITQCWYEVTENQRLASVAALLRHFRPASSIAFCNTRARCAALAELLQAQGFSALALHGDLDQRDRDQVLVRFSNGSCSVLVGVLRHVRHTFWPTRTTLPGPTSTTSSSSPIWPRPAMKTYNSSTREWRCQYPASSPGSSAFAVMPMYCMVSSWSTARRPSREVSGRYPP